MLMLILVLMLMLMLMLVLQQWQKKYFRSYFVDVGVDVDGNEFFFLVLLMIPSCCRPWRSALKLDVIQPESC